MKSAELQRGWRVVVAGAVGAGFGMPILPVYTLGPMIRPLTEEFGWERADVQLALMFSTGFGALVTVFAGMIIDRFGVRQLVLLSQVLLAACIACTTFLAGSLWFFYACYAGMALLGAGTSPITWTRAVNMEFQHRRGLALALILAGAGFAGVLAPPVTTWAIAALGWRGAYISIAASSLLIAFPVAYFFLREKSGSDTADADVAHDAPAIAHRGFTIAQAFRKPQLWLMMGSILLVYFAMSGASNNIIPLMMDRKFSAMEAALLQSTFGLAMVAGRLLVGYMFDRFWAPAVGAASLVLAAAGAALLVMDLQSLGAARLAVILLGLAAGAELDLIAYLTARYFGMAHYGKLYGLQYTCLAVVGGIAPYAFGRWADLAGSYDPAFAFGTGLLLVGGFLLLFLGRYPAYEDFPNSSELKS